MNYSLLFNHLKSSEFNKFPVERLDNASTEKNIFFSAISKWRMRKMNENIFNDDSHLNSMKQTKQMEMFYFYTRLKVFPSKAHWPSLKNKMKRDALLSRSIKISKKIRKKESFVSLSRVTEVLCSIEMKISEATAEF